MYISVHTRLKKVLALLAIFAMVGTSVPVGALTVFAQEITEEAAEEAENTDTQVVDQTASEEAEEEVTISAPTEAPLDEATDSAPIVDEATNTNFVVDANGIATIDTVALGVTYTAPQNSQVQVTFTQLPEVPGSLSIQEVLLTDEQVEQLGALSNVAYDITSNMANGTFSYDLKLPLPEGVADEAQVVFAETAADLAAGAVEAVATDKIEVASEDQTVAVSALDHFTIFVITSFEEVQVTPPDTGYNGEWTAWGTSASVTKVPTGTNGIISSEGDNHAVVQSGAYTAWDGYKSVFPTGGYNTRVDVYVDMALATGEGVDKRLDFSSAISNTTGGHRRDFIFSLGTNPSTANEWLVSASNNSIGWPGNPARSPITLTETGWYTLEHQFRDVDGVLEVTLNIYKKGESTPLGSWVLTDASDIIGSTVGGNRYGWFIDTDSYRFNEIVIDGAEIEYASKSINETTVQVSPAGLAGWSETTTGAGNVDFISAADAPIGPAALNLTTQNDNNDRAALARDEDVPLAKVTTLKYTTNRGSGFQPEGNASYRIRIDADGNTETTNDTAYLIYEPYWQNGGVGDAAPIITNEWQTWDVSKGIFWASIPGGNTVSGLINGAGGPPFYSIADVLALHPNAKVIGLNIGVGSYNLNYNILVDAVVFGYEAESSFEVVTYDFTTAPVGVPTDLRYDNPANACDGFTNVNYTQPKWGIVLGDISYDYQALFNGSVVYGPVNFGTNAHPGGTFGGGQNGVWGFQVRSVDAQGEKSDWSPVCEITLDTVAPAAPVHESPADNSTLYVNDFYFDWTDVADVVEYEFQAAQDPTVDGNGALTNGVWNNKASGAPDRDFLASSTIHSYGANGTWYWQVRAIDAAGNKSPWTTPWKMTIDLDGPDPDVAPQVSIIDPSPEEGMYVRGLITGHATATDDLGMGSYYLRFWKDAFEIAGGGTLVHGCQMAPGGDLLGTDEDASCVYDTRLNPDGPYVFSAQFQDSDINWGQALRNFIVDNTKPVVSLDNPSTTQNVFRSDAVDFIVSATDNLALNRITGNIYQGGTLFRSNSQVASGTAGVYTIDIDTLPEGEYTLRYNANDKAGNVASTKTFDFTIDNTAPTVTIKSESVGNGVDRFTNVSFKLYDLYKIDKLTLNGVPKDLTNNQWSDLNGVYPGDWFGGVEGENTLVVYDVAGNATTLVFTLDTTAPAVPTGLAWTDSDSNNVADMGTTSLYAGTASWNENTESDFDHYIYKYWNEIDGSDYNNEAAPWTLNMPGVSNTSAAGVFNQGEGVHHFCVVAVDTLGNESACSDDFTITYFVPDENEGGGQDEGEGDGDGEETAPEEEPSFSGSSSTRLGSRSSSRPEGQVLGASTSLEDGDFCVEPYLVASLGLGRENDSAQVVRLQKFLNEHLGASLAVTGVFETTTESAVKDFQLRYAADVLTPWGITSPTGFVYLTTKKKINELVCQKAFPLTPEELEEIDRVKNQVLEGAGTLSVPAKPEETVAGAATSNEQMNSASDEDVAPVGTVAEEKQDEERGFLGRLWDKIFGN